MPSVRERKGTGIKAIKERKKREGKTRVRNAGGKQVEGRNEAVNKKSKCTNQIFPHEVNL